MTVHIFTGPTISIDRAQAACPEAIVHGPVAHLDLLRLDASPGDLVAVIDGVFYHAPPVRHKEILWLLHRGVTVVGAASMGALRAAELHRYGMRGVGRIAAMYTSGALEADDEVGVAHAGPEDGYRPFSDALVNIREAVARGCAAGVLTAEAGQAIIASAAGTFFAQRRLRTAVQQCVGSGALTRVAADAFLSWAAHHSWDLKAEDASELLTMISQKTLMDTADSAAASHAPRSAPGSALPPTFVADGAQLGRWLSQAQILTAGLASASRSAVEDVLRLFALDAADMVLDRGIRRLLRLAGQARGHLDRAALGLTADVRETLMGYCESRDLIGAHGLPADTIGRLLTRTEIDRLTASERQLLAAIRIAASAAAPPPDSRERAGPEPGRLAAIEFAAHAADFNARLAEQAPHYRPDHIAERTAVAFYRDLWRDRSCSGVGGVEEFAVQIRIRGFPDMRAFLRPARTYLPYARHAGPPGLRWRHDAISGCPHDRQPADPDRAGSRGAR
jgi:hypothetical protein